VIIEKGIWKETTESDSLKDLSWLEKELTGLWFGGNMGSLEGLGIDRFASRLEKMVNEENG